jgi:glyoxylase-like metal-dependent hydrolase (beta-lactamase superfamily II)
MSATEAEAADRPDLIPDVPIALGKLVRRVLCNNPGMMTGPGTNTYLIGQDEIAVIDPGPDDADHLDAIAAAGSGRIKWILCTHTHGDHSPGAAGLKERTGAEVLAFADRDGLVCDRHLADGDTIEGTEFTLRAIHTPGHASNHLCFLLERDRLLFSGDHVMDGSTVVITPLDGDMREYLDALQRLQALRPSLKAIAPAHGHLITDPEAKLEDYVAHRLEREAQVLVALQGFGSEGVDTAGLVAAIYTDVPEFLWPVARFSVWAHLRKLSDEGAARAVDADDPDTRWTATS